MTKGDNDVPGLTDAPRARTKGPKRANNIRKMFNLEGEDDVSQYVVKKEVEKDGETIVLTPKIQRLITDRRLRRKKSQKKIKKARFQLAKQNKEEYEKVLSNFIKEKKAQRVAAIKETAQE